MFDRWEYTVPAGTKEADAIRVECKISPGVLTDLVVFFPPGCHGLVKSKVYLGEKPIAPRSDKQCLAADAFAVELHHVNELISENRPVLNWFLWAPETSYPHTLWMSAEWISADEPYEKRGVRVMEDFVGIFKRLLGL